MLRHAGSRVRHGFGKLHIAGVLVPGLEAVVRLSCGVNQRLAGPGRAADGQLLQGSAVAPRRVALEMRQHQHGIIIQDILSQTVFLQNLPVRNGPHHIRSFRVHQIHIEIFRPAMLLQKLKMRLRIVAHAACGVAVGCVALHNRAMDLIHHRLPEFRMQEILISLLAGMNLHRHLPRQRGAQRMIQLHHRLRGEFPRKINLRFHKAPSCSF